MKRMRLLTALFGTAALLTTTTHAQTADEIIKKYLEVTGVRQNGELYSQSKLPEHLSRERWIFLL